MKIEVISGDTHLNYHLKFCRNRTKTSIIFLNLTFFKFPSMESRAVQKRSSHVQITLTSKPFELEFPDTTQMKDLSKSFLSITDFISFFLN